MSLLRFSGAERNRWYAWRAFQFYFAEAKYKSVTYITGGKEKKRAEWRISKPGEDMDFVTKEGTQMYVNDLYCKQVNDDDDKFDMMREFKFKMGSVKVDN